MENIPTEKDLKIQYGPIYDKLFLDSKKSSMELLARQSLIQDHLIDNPSDIFQSDNTETINAFLFEKDNYIVSNRNLYEEKEFQKYTKLKNLWKVIRLFKDGVLSKPAFHIILNNISLRDVKAIYDADRQFKKVIDKIGYWENKLKEFNYKDNINYQDFITDLDAIDIVLLISDVKKLLGPKQTVKKFLATRRLYTDKTEQVQIILNILPFLINLQELKISKRKNLTFSSTTPFKTLKNLKALTIWGLDFSEITENLFEGLDNLAYLYIFGENNKQPPITSQIKTFPKNIFKNLESLIDLYIGSFPIKTLSKNIFDNLVNLEELYLSKNLLTSLPNFNKLQKLKKLNLSYNHLTFLKEGVFIGLDNLERLDLANNKIKTIEPNTFMDLPKLFDLFLSSNKIKPPTFRNLNLPNKDTHIFF